MLENTTKTNHQYFIQDDEEERNILIHNSSKIHFKYFNFHERKNYK